MNLHVFHHHHFADSGNADSATATLLAEILENQKTIMSAISDFATKLSAFQDAQDKAIADITTEIAALNTTIAALQNSTGAITPSDQALLNTAEARASAAATKLAALDTLVPPPVPVTPAA